MMLSLVYRFDCAQQTVRIDAGDNHLGLGFSQRVQ
jgi:hypothetical protein